MDYIDLFYKRLIELRLQKGVSARDMSLSLGQSESYINKIENRRTLPSLQGFFYICDYLDITPGEFFNFSLNSPAKAKEISSEIEGLSPLEAEHILLLIKDLKNK